MKKTRLKLRNEVQGAGRFNCGWNAGKSLVPCPWQERRRRERTRGGLCCVRIRPSASVVRSLAGIGTTPTGLDVDSAGNVYVALNGNHQIAKFNPTASSFQPATFGSGGRIGGSGTGDGQFNGPFDVAVTPDGGSIYVSDSGNHRIQQFTQTGTFVRKFGSQGSGLAQFNTPKGLAFDTIGTLHVVDAGNNRLARVVDSVAVWTSGSAGTALGQFQGAVNLGVGKRGLYVADTGNNRAEVFDSPQDGVGLNARLVLSSQLGLNQPWSVTAVADFLVEKLYIADTGNNRVLLVQLPADGPEAVWNAMKQRLLAGDIAGAIPYFSLETADQYRQTFLDAGTTDLIQMISAIPAITPVVIENNSAQYRFDRVLQGLSLTFPIEFTKENGLWKIVEF